MRLHKSSFFPGGRRFAGEKRGGMRFHRRAAGLLLALVMLCAQAAPLNVSAKEPYTYTVRFLAGGQGSFDPKQDAGSGSSVKPASAGADMLVFRGLKAGDRVSFSSRMVRVKDSSKYYVKGIRESGRDNNTIYNSAFIVQSDKDYVVAYGILGDSVAYTVHYEDASGKRLAPSETYYGNVGDRPVVAYLYVEGYQPQAYNLTRTLVRNAAENVFTFVYTPIERDGGGNAAPPAPNAPGDTEETVTEVRGGGGGGAAGAGAAGGADEDGAQETEETEAEDTQEDGEEDGEPREVESLDGEVPLDQGGGIEGEDARRVLPDLSSDFALLLLAPLSVKAGICSAAALIIGSILYFIILRRRKEEENE